MELLLIIFILLLFIINIILYNKTKKIKIYKDTINKEKQKELDILLKNKENIINEIESLNIIKKDKEKEIKNTEEIYNVTKKSFENYCDILDNEYEYKNKEWNDSIYLLEQSYQKIQDNILLEIQNNKEKLKEIMVTKESAIKAKLKEEEIKNKKEFYCPQVSKNDLKDIKILKDIEYKLNNPRVLRMLIWQTYYQKPINQVCINVLGSATVEKCGIYKITNQLNDCSYIGQAVDICTRWKNHAKCGLGIDTPQNNKLYKAIYEDGLENFSFEVLELCPKEELNKKESFYIKLYKTNEYGYNSIAGNTKDSIL